jgi:hypothetical protein
MPTVQLTLPEPHVAQNQIKAEAARYNVLACGRRFGKTLLGEDLIIEPALSSYPVGWFSPTYKMLLDVWRELTNVLLPIIKRSSVQEHRIELVTGGVLDMWSLDDANAGRGRKYKRVVIDEAAMVAKLEEAWNAAIRPTLTDYQGDAWFLSTPKGYNFFRTIFAWGQDAAYPEWRSWQMPTSANPFISATEIEAARQGSPERYFAQEYEAIFLQDGGGVFRRVAEAATAERQEQAIAGHQYVIGADWGRTNDATVFKVIDVTLREECYSDRMTQTDFRTQLTRLQALAERFGQPAIVGEYNSIGGPQVEALQNMGLAVQPFTTTNATKAKIIDMLALAFERGELKILNDPLTVTELQAYESERLPSGLIRYGAPDGMHDDAVIALCLAWYGASYAATDLIEW